MAISGNKLKEPDKTCNYYPCHFEEQDCTWCYCPFYPCNDPRTGGKLIERKRKRNRITSDVGASNMVWSCKDCYWVHQEKGAQLILKNLQNLTTFIEKWSHKKVFHSYSKRL